MTVGMCHGTFIYIYWTLRYILKNIRNIKQNSKQQTNKTDMKTEWLYFMLPNPRRDLWEMCLQNDVNHKIFITMRYSGMKTER